MSLLLARLARTLAQHWKRSLAVAIVVLILLGVAAGAGGEAADDFSIPGTESQQALDLFKAHSPAFAGADSTLVFSVEDGSITDPQNRAGRRGRARRGGEACLTSRRSRTRSGATAGSPRTAASRPSDVRYDVEATDLDKEDGEKLEAAARTAEQDGVDVAARGVLIDLASEQDAPGRRADRRRRRDRPAHHPVPLGSSDGGHDRRRAARRDGRTDPARRARRAARAAAVRDGHRGDARAGRGHRLLAAHHRPLQRAGRARRQHARRRRQVGGDLGRVGGRRRPDRDGRDRRSARDRHPADRQARASLRRSASAPWWSRRSRSCRS